MVPYQVQKKKDWDEKANPRILAEKFVKKFAFSEEVLQISWNCVGISLINVTMVTYHSYFISWNAE